MNTTEKIANRLINETSPYLLQHARNPVDWWPWCDEAFAKAKREDKPVFLSSGYSTCHWCHVMAHESFEDETVAALLNRHFVPIKVDREERPDVDHVYMNACVAITGSGGWPLSVFLDPNRRPFFAGTYFPKNDNYGKPGFISLLTRLLWMWHTQRQTLTRSAIGLVDAISERQGEPGGLDDGLVQKTVELLMESYDRQWGGFGREPKFPSPHNLMFLMRAAHRETPDSKVWRAVGHTLSAMAAGGLRDHVGGGFCRYSTDREWLIPHFEKMLYDNAMLCMAYTEYYQKTGEFSEIIHEIIAYIRREMRAPDGCFYTAQDADSEGEEGKFYCWTPCQVMETLGERDGARFCGLYDITEQGNFEGRGIPNLIGAEFRGDDALFAAQALPRLYEERCKRVPPLRDEKVLLTGNALMCAALAKAGRALDNAEYTQMARVCADALLEGMEDGGGLLAVRGARHAATLDGYAYLTWALLEVYGSVFETRYLDEALRIHEMTTARFADDDGLLYYSDSQDLPARGVNAHDGATPSGQSVAAGNGVRLSRLTGDHSYEAQSGRLMKALSEEINSHPQAYTWMLAARLHMENGGADATVVRGDGDGRLLSALRGFRPFLTVTLRDPDKTWQPIDGRASAYLCMGETCMPPVNDPAKLSELLAR